MKGTKVKGTEVKGLVVLVEEVERTGKLTSAD